PSHSLSTYTVCLFYTHCRRPHLPSFPPRRRSQATRSAPAASANSLSATRLQRAARSPRGAYRRGSESLRVAPTSRPAGTTGGGLPCARAPSRPPQDRWQPPRPVGFSYEKMAPFPFETPGTRPGSRGRRAPLRCVVAPLVGTTGREPERRTPLRRGRRSPLRERSTAPRGELPPRAVDLSR